MNTWDRLRQLFAYDEWANHESISSLKQAGTLPSQALRRMAHVLGTQYVWHSRIVGEASRSAVWPELSLGECENHTTELGKIWRDYLRANQGRLEQTVTYKNTKGEAWTDQIENILMHVIMHGAYHRGQIASDLRAAGYTPAYTDFIHAVRQKLIG